MSSIDINTLNRVYLNNDLSSTYSVNPEGSLVQSKLPSELEVMLDSASLRKISNSYVDSKGKILRHVLESPILDTYQDKNNGLNRNYIDPNLSEKNLSYKITRNKLAELAAAYQADMYNSSKLN